LQFGLEEEVVVNRRNGAVIAKGTIIKVNVLFHTK
jgi:hypothetical protein